MSNNAVSPRGKAQDFDSCIVGSIPATAVWVTAYPALSKSREWIYKGVYMGTFKDITGEQYNRLTVIGYRHGERKSGRKVIYWKCRCKCGNEIEVEKYSLTNGNTQSCGCLNKEINSKRSCLDLTGQRYGRLTVLERVSEMGAPKVLWKCRCDCGKERIIKAESLRNGDTVSCGCYSIDRMIQYSTKHGLRYTRIYDIYCGMKKRCYNKDSASYKYYGGRGIDICQEWLNDFTRFYEWSMSHGYSDTLTIDRIDNDKGYSPDNCQWITKGENSRKRNIEYWSKRHKESIA